ncbi:hypothetical protein U0070_005000 [Myodes glareolus]|uniref:Uncharacterized protein n=1 Tax=Myodes glareolus TaxID=447135 RepID=A0AAW0K408_MYOGA
MREMELGLLSSRVPVPLPTAAVGTSASSHRCCAVGRMDDDDFGGFEAAETFDGEHNGNQAMSPAVPWATFPAGTTSWSLDPFFSCN